jgi:hypothetical protein
MTAKLKLVDSNTGAPPRPLGKFGAALWRSISTDFDISDAAGIELLTLACESLDRAEEIKSLINYAGVGAVSETGHVRANPLLRDELACRAFVSKCIERLGVNQEPTKAVGRPAESWNHAKAPKQSA